jgi:hypothetical protein
MPRCSGKSRNEVLNSVKGSSEKGPLAAARQALGLACFWADFTPRFNSLQTHM